MINKINHRDETDSVADKSTQPAQDSERVGVSCDENTPSDPNSPNEQNRSLGDTELYEKGNNAENKESLVNGNLKGSVKEDHKSGYDKDLMAEGVYKVVIGVTWPNKPCSKRSSTDEPAASCASSEVPAESDPPAQDSSTKWDSPPTQDSPVNLVNPSVDDNRDDVPSGEDGKTNNADTDVHVTPCGQDQNDRSNIFQSSTSEGANVESPVGEGESTNHSNESAVSECGSNLKPTIAAGTAESSKTPISEGECNSDFNNPRGQDETGESSQSDESDFVCGQRVVQNVHVATEAGTTASPCSATNSNPPTNTQSNTAETSAPAETESVDKGSGASSENSATSLDANETNMTSTESTVSSLTNGCASKGISCDTPCTDPPIDTKSEGCDVHVNTPGECQNESTDVYDGGSLTEQNPVAVVNLMVSSDSSIDIPLTTDAKSEDGPYQHEAAEIKSEERSCTADPDEMVTVGTKPAYQPDDDRRDTTLISYNVNSITETVSKADDDGASINSPVNTGMPDDKSTDNVTDVAECPPSVCDTAKANSSSTMLSSDKYEAFYIKISQISWSYSTKRTLSLPLLLSLLIYICFIQPASSQKEPANFTISNVTEILSSMMWWNESESFPIDDQSEKLHIYWTIVIGVAVELLCIAILCRPMLLEKYNFIIAFLKKAHRNACSFAWYVLRLLECIKHRNGQQVETMLSPTSATVVHDSAQHLVVPSEETTPTRATEHHSSSAEPVSYKVSETSTPPNSNRLQQSVDSGYQSQTPIPDSCVVLLSGNDGRVHGNGESLLPRSDLQSASVQSSELSSQTTEPDSVDVLTQVSPPDNRNQRAYHGNSAVECTRAENCNPGELVSVGFRMMMFRTDVSRGGVQQEETQPGNRTSELAGVSYRHRERMVQVLPPRVLTLDIPQANAGPSPIQTVAVRIDPVLAFNATVEESEHSAPPDPAENVPDYTPIVLEHSLLNSEQGLLLSAGLADAEVHMFQLQDLPYARAYPALGGMTDSVPVYPPLPSVPSANAELQPVWPPLPVTPSTSTPMVVIPVTYVP